jgi:hypothetical protein
MPQDGHEVSNARFPVGTRIAETRLVPPEAVCAAWNAPLLPASWPHT